MIAHHVVGGAIAHHPYFIENLIDFAAHNTAIAQSSQKVDLGFAWILVKSRVRCCQLRQQFCKLAQLNEACTRVVLEVTLRQCPQLDKPRLVTVQKAKVGRQRWPWHDFPGEEKRFF
jgi:hypothetical protein